MWTGEFSNEGVVLGRLDRGQDLLEGLYGVCSGHGLQAATVRAIGALEKARLGHYDQQRGRYVELEFDGPLEIAWLGGNLSLKAARPFLHLHAVCGRPDGSCVGGHVLEGCRVFACEFEIIKLAGAPPRRAPDGPTGLELWS